MDLCYPILPLPLPQLQSFSTAAFVRSSHFWCHLRSFPSPSTVLASLSSLPFPPLLPLWYRCGEEGFGEPREGNGRKELGGGAWKRDRGRRRRTLEVEEWSGAAVEASRGRRDWRCSFVARRRCRCRCHRRRRLSWATSKRQLQTEGPDFPSGPPLSPRLRFSQFTQSFPQQ